MYQRRESFLSCDPLGRSTNDLNLVVNVDIKIRLVNNLLSNHPAHAGQSVGDNEGDWRGMAYSSMTSSSETTPIAPPSFPGVYPTRSSEQLSSLHELID